MQLRLEVPTNANADVMMMTCHRGCSVVCASVCVSVSARACVCMCVFVPPSVCESVLRDYKKKVGN